MVQLPVKKHLCEKITQPNCAWLSVLEMGQRSLRTGYSFIPERACLYQDGRRAVQDPAYCSSCCGAQTKDRSACSSWWQSWGAAGTGPLDSSPENVKWRKTTLRRQYTNWTAEISAGLKTSTARQNESMGVYWSGFFSDLWRTILFSFYS